MQFYPGTYACFDRERLPISNTVVPLTTAKFKNTGSNPAEPARKALLAVEGDQVRITLDGTDPVSGATIANGKGILLSPGDVWVFELVGQIAAAKLIRETTDAYVEVIYFR